MNLKVEVRKEREKPGGLKMAEWFEATKEALSPDDVLTGLLDHGLFAEKIPPCFTTAGLA